LALGSQDRQPRLAFGIEPLRGDLAELVPFGFAAILLIDLQEQTDRWTLFPGRLFTN